MSQIVKRDKISIIVTYAELNLFINKVLDILHCGIYRTNINTVKDDAIQSSILYTLFLNPLESSPLPGDFFFRKYKTQVSHPQFLSKPIKCSRPEKFFKVKSIATMVKF